ncbi:MAG TPA: isoprenylcysteine carboxyl methyltransferase [Desulfomonilia bacterium]|nr:isoprenylcysteine carboxyl methyltransferase [Desulfomonilia bacterium]
MLPQDQVLPESCTSMPINLTGLLCFFGSLYFINYLDLDAVYGSIFAILILSTSIIVLELIFLKTCNRPSTGLDFTSSKPLDLKRVFVKIVGLYFTLGLAALYYWVFPEYHTSFYDPYWKFIRYILPAILIGGIPYFIILDGFSTNPRDGYWHMGMLVLGNWKVLDRHVIVQHLLGWLVKTFFLAIMFSFLVNNINFIKMHGLIKSLSSFRLFYDYAYNLIFTVDLAFVCGGYLLTLRIFDSHMRSVEPTVLGWMAAVICYKPFWGFIYNSYLNYDDNLYWGDWLWTHQYGYIIWGSAILFLLSVYLYATIPFGIRFSNLTHRGILTNGPYRFMKHPAYLSKNLSWWLISIPFISRVSLSDAAKNSILLLILNIIYYIRAITEERHLSKDPTYVHYASMMNAKGLCRGFARIFPFLRYNPDKFTVKD